MGFDGKIYEYYIVFIFLQCGDGFLSAHCIKTRDLSDTDKSLVVVYVLCSN